MAVPEPQVAPEKVTQPAVPDPQAAPEKVTQPPDANRRSRLLDFEVLKAAATYVGIVGTGGGGFAALSFGIGYLAIKHHDEMMGLPGSIASNTAYVRTGALFFTNSLYYMFTVIFSYLTAIFSYLIVAVGVALGILMIIALARKFSPALLQKICPLDVWRRIELPSFYITQFVLLFLAVLLVHYQVAAFDPMNKNLLYKLVVERDKPTASTPATAAASTDSSSSLRKRLGENLNLLVQAVTLQESSVLAKGINKDLHRADGPLRLQRRYGLQLALFLLLCAAIVLTRRWRLRLHRETIRPTMLFLVHWFIRPVVYGLAGVFLFNLPANYGVLCLQSASAWVQIRTVESRPPKWIYTGYLLSDLSSETKEVWILGEDSNKNVVLAVFKREQLLSINVIEPRPNILASEE